MSDAETEQALGRAHIALKRVKSNAAIIRASLLEHAKTLEETGRLVRQFVNDPAHKNSSFVPLSAHLKAQLELISQFSAGQIDQLVKESTSITELQNQVDQF